MPNRTIFTTPFTNTTPPGRRRKLIGKNKIDSGVGSIDLIFAEDKVINSENLVCPHPRYLERRFVLEPLLELFPNGEFFGNKFLKSAEEIDGQFVRIADKIDIK